MGDHNFTCPMRRTLGKSSSTLDMAIASNSNDDEIAHHSPKKLSVQMTTEELVVWFHIYKNEFKIWLWQAHGEISSTSGVQMMNPIKRKLNNDEISRHLLRRVCIRTAVEELVARFYSWARGERVTDDKIFRHSHSAIDDCRHEISSFASHCIK